MTKKSKPAPNDRAQACLVRATMVSQLNADGLRLICGELTNQEIRTIRAIVNYILAK